VIAPKISEMSLCWPRSFEFNHLTEFIKSFTTDILNWSRHCCTRQTYSIRNSFSFLRNVLHYVLQCCRDALSAEELSLDYFRKIFCCDSGPLLNAQILSSQSTDRVYLFFELRIITIFKQQYLYCIRSSHAQKYKIFPLPTSLGKFYVQISHTTFLINTLIYKSRDSSVCIATRLQTGR
jgi:hypothetical protein